MKQKWAVQNTVYLEADSYEEAIKAFWERMAKANVGSVVAMDPLPRCFVSEVEGVEASHAA